MDRLEIGKFYKLLYKEEYSDMDVFTVQVQGITDFNNVNTVSEDSIYDLYYEPYGKTLTQYLTDMGSNSTVYICSTIKSERPVELDEVMVIPAVILEFGGIDLLLSTEDITITIDGLFNHFNSLYEKGLYIEEMEKELTTVLKTVSKIGNSPLDITINMQDYLEFKTVIDDNNKMIEESFALVKKARDLERSKDEQRYRAIKDKSEELYTKEENLNRRETNINDLVNSLNETKSSYQTGITALNGVKQDISDLLNGLEDNSIVVDTTEGSAYQQLKTKIVNFISS